MTASSSLWLLVPLAALACVDAPPFVDDEPLGPDPQGDWVRVLSAGDSSGNQDTWDQYRDCVFDGGRVVAVGAASPGGTFEPGGAAATELAVNNLQDATLVIYDFDGVRDESIAPAYGGDGNDQFEAVAVGEGRVFVGGSFFGEVDFLGTTLESTTGLDGVVLALDDGNALDWSQQFSSIGRTLVRALTFDGQLVVAGRFSGDDANVGGKDPVDLEEGGVEDVFVSRFQADGDRGGATEVRNIRGIDDARAVVTVDGKIYTAGMTNVTGDDSSRQLFIANPDTAFAPETTNLAVAMGLTATSTAVCAVGRFSSEVDFTTGKTSGAAVDGGFVTCRDLDDVEVEEWTVTTSSGARFDAVTVVDDGTGGMLVAIGSYLGTVEVGSTMLPETQAQSAFVAFIDASDGTVIDVVRVPGLSGEQLIVRGMDLSGERLCIAGAFEGELEQPDAEESISSDGVDAFVWLGRVDLPTRGF